MTTPRTLLLFLLLLTLTACPQSGQPQVEPKFEVSPATLTLAPDEQASFNLHYSRGQGALAFTLTTSEPWLKLLDNAGQPVEMLSLSLQAAQTQVVQLAISGTPAGATPEGSVLIRSSAGEANVTVRVAKPLLTVTPPTVQLEPGASALFTLSHNATAALEVTLDSSAAWLGLRSDGLPTSENLRLNVAAGETKTVTVTADAALVGWASEGQVTIRSSAGESRLMVTLPQATRLVLRQTRLDLGRNSSGQVHIRNAGEQVLEGRVSSGERWLRLEGGANLRLEPGAEATLELVVNRSPVELLPGTHVTALDIVSNGGAASVNVTMEVSSYSGLNACSAPTSLTLATPSVSSLAAAPSEGYVPGQILVRLEDSLLSPQGLSSLAGYYGLTLLRSGGGEGPELFATSATDIEALAARLQRDPRVRYAEPNRFLEAQSLPNDPDLANAWHLCNFGLPSAWAIETGNPDVIIAILDSGVDTEHEDLRTQVLPGYDFCANRSGACSMRDADPRPGGTMNLHGTHVAGIAAAAGNNGVGLLGVAPGARLLPIKVFNDAGGGATFAALVEGVRWALGLPVDDVPINPNPAQILNLSLGANGNSETLNEMVALARRHGAIVIVASGNDSNPTALRTPANAPGAFAVGAVNSNYQRLSASNYAMQPDQPTVQLLAPGGFSLEPLGCTNRKIPSTHPDNRYGCDAGTSMAAPFVSGVAALIWSQNPALSADEVQQRLLEATYLEPGADPREYGAGVLCADRAVGAATLCGR